MEPQTLLIVDDEPAQSIAAWRNMPSIDLGDRGVPFIIAAAWLWLLLVLPAAPLGAAEPVPVFVLHSYSQEYPWTRGQHSGFMDVLNADKARGYDVRAEYLDTKRTGYTPAYGDLIAGQLREKYRGYRPAAVYVSDDNALSFALTHLDQIFPQVPVFFSGVNDYGVRPRLDPARVTGVFEKKEIGPNLELMRMIARDVREILVVGDATETYRAIEHEIRLELARQPGISATFISAARIEDLIARLKAQRTRFVFLTTLGAIAGPDGRKLTLPETIGAIVKAGDFVVFSMEDAYLYPGVLGGYVTSGPRQGGAAAGLLRRWLDGEPLTALPPIEASPKRLHRRRYRTGARGARPAAGCRPAGDPSERPADLLPGQPSAGARQPLCPGFPADTGSDRRPEPLCPQEPADRRGRAAALRE